MSFHVGIDLVYDCFSVYNEESKETIDFGITTKINEKSKKEDIEKMFEEIKTKINGKLGYACIYLPSYYYGNEIRKSFIEKGKEFGFLNVQIINLNSKVYLSYITTITQKPKNGDIIWISTYKELHIWKKLNLKAKMVKKFEYETNEELIEIVKKEKNDNDNDNEISPDILISTDNRVPDLNFIKTLFPKCQIFVANTNLTTSDAVLIKARIMAKDEEVLEFDIDAHIDENIDVKINENIVMSKKMYESLPFEKTTTIYNRKNVIKIFVGGKFKDEFSVSPPIGSSPPYEIVIKVDSNRVITIKYISRSYVIPKILNSIGNINAVGIDLGTSRCCAAVSRRNTIETIALDNTGERLLPSYVSYNEDYALCGQLVVNQLQNYAKSTVFDAKRIIGKRYLEIKISESWPFEVVDYHGKPILRIQNNKHVFARDPEEIASVILKHIKQKAEEIQGKKLIEVVITVPAAFNKKQREATSDAAKLAGWKTVHLLPEPVAASIAYFIDRPIPNEFNMLLFDFGGGTLDVCIFKVNNDYLQIISEYGDTNLGGRDFDNVLFSYFSNKLKNEFQIDVNSKDKYKYRLFQKCIDIKHALSIQTEARFDISDFDNNVDQNLIITRQEFETMVSSLLSKIKNCIMGALADTNFTSRDINKVLLAGGSCRMPMIKLLLHELFTRADHCCEENPDEVVAIGAAYYANYLLHEQKTIFKKKRMFGTFEYLKY